MLEWCLVVKHVNDRDHDLRARRLIRRPDTGGNGGRDGNALIGHQQGRALHLQPSAILLVAAILGFPVIYGTWQSFFQGPEPRAPVDFVGFENYTACSPGPSSGTR